MDNSDCQKTLEEREKEYKLDEATVTKSVEWYKPEHYTNSLYRSKCDMYACDATYKNYLIMDTMKVREDDVFIVTFPKSGTTWVQEVTYLIQNNFDTEKVKKGTIEERMPCIDYQDLDAIEQLASPRILKSHWALPVLPKGIWEKKAKVIYVVRNPKDVAVSFFHFTKAFNGLFGFHGDFETACKQFIDGRVYGGPWWLHVNHGVSHPLVHVVYYEDLIQKPREEIVRIAKYLGKEINEAQIDLVQNYCSFESMRANPSTNFTWMVEQGIIKNDVGFQFMRKGKVGDWINHFSVENSKLFDEMVENMCTNGESKQKLQYGISHDDFVKMKAAQQQ